MQCQDSILIKGDSHRLTEFFSQREIDAFGSWLLVHGPFPHFFRHFQRPHKNPIPYERCRVKKARGNRGSVFQSLRAVRRLAIRLAATYGPAIAKSQKGCRVTKVREKTAENTNTKAVATRSQRGGTPLPQ